MTCSLASPGSSNASTTQTRKETGELTPTAPVHVRSTTSAHACRRGSDVRPEVITAMPPGPPQHAFCNVMATFDDRSVVPVDDHDDVVFSGDLRPEQAPPYATLLMVRRIGSPSNSYDLRRRESRCAHHRIASILPRRIWYKRTGGNVSPLGRKVMAKRRIFEVGAVGLLVFIGVAADACSSPLPEPDGNGNAAATVGSGGGLATGSGGTSGQGDTTSLAGNASTGGSSAADSGYLGADGESSAPPPGPPVACAKLVDVLAGYFPFDPTLAASASECACLSGQIGGQAIQASPPITWTDAVAQFPSCPSSQLVEAGAELTRCGTYNAVIYVGIDGFRIVFYNQNTGKQLGQVGSEGTCLSYDATFTAIPTDPCTCGLHTP